MSQTNSIFNNNHNSFDNNINIFNIIDNTPNFYNLFIINDENFDDNVAINCNINTWRKPYFEFLVKVLNVNNKKYD